MTPSNYIITGLTSIATNTSKPYSQSEQVVAKKFASLVNEEISNDYKNSISDETLRLLSPRLRQLIKTADLKLGSTVTLKTTDEPSKNISDIIADKGFMAYQKDEYIKSMKERIRNDVIHQLGITEDILETLPKEDHLRIEAIIQDLVKQRMNSELREKREAAANKIKDETLFQL